MNTVPTGVFWDGASLVWGREAGRGEVEEAHSLSGAFVQSYRPLDRSELDLLFAPLAPSPTVELPPLQARLVQLLLQHRSVLIESIALSTGFVDEDVADVFQGLLDFLKGFETPTPKIEVALQSGNRRIGLRRVPFGSVAAILPQNAFEILALTCTLNALLTGNRIILRAPRACVRSAALLGRLLLEAGFPKDSFSVVLCDAKAFIDAALESGTHPLVHYMGGSSRAGDLLSRCFEAGSNCLIDGDGNTHVYVDGDQDPGEVAKILWEGAIRFNGQTCTSIVGATLHPTVDQEVRLHLRKFASTSGAPRRLFSEAQAKNAHAIIGASSGRLGRAGNPSGNIFFPTLVEDPEPESSLVSDGIFAPALWVRTGDFQHFASTWTRNRFPLCAGIFCHSIEPGNALTALPGAARVVINGDPSIEDVLEPWGGYPASGNHEVGPWHHKYQRVVQIDSPTNA